MAGRSTTLAFPVASGTAASTAIAVLNTGVASTALGAIALAADGSVLALEAMPALPPGATTAFTAADAFAPQVLDALATVQVVADQPLTGSALASGAAATDVTLTTAPARAGTALGLSLFMEGAGMPIRTVVRVFNPDAGAVTVSVQALDPAGRC